MIFVVMNITKIKHIVIRLNTIRRLLYDMNNWRKNESG